MAKSFTTHQDPEVVPTGRILRGMRQAKLAARLSDGKQRVGAAVYNSGNCVSTASNTMKKSHPGAVDVYEYPYPHAEWRALNGLAKIYSPGNLTVYVTRILNNDKEAMAKPCMECTKMLSDMGVGSVYYSDNDGIIRKLKQ